jgi:hypothetical protein
VHTLAVLVHAHLGALRCAWARRRDDGGLSTLEVAVIAVGLLGLAIALVTAVTAAVNSRLEQIQ